jgi:hypothetical protein
MGQAGRAIENSFRLSQEGTKDHGRAAGLTLPGRAGGRRALWSPFGRLITRSEEPHHRF